MKKLTNRFFIVLVCVIISSLYFFNIKALAWGDGRHNDENTIVASGQVTEGDVFFTSEGGSVEVALIGSDIVGDVTEIITPPLTDSTNKKEESKKETEEKEFEKEEETSPFSDSPLWVIGVYKEDPMSRVSVAMRITKVTENKSVVKAEDDNQYLYIAGFISMTYMDLMSEEYSFQFDAKGTYSGEVAAAFIRGWGELTFPVPKNPNGCGYFEDDGTPTKFTSTTGIGLWFKENGKLTLFVKTNDSSQEAGIGNIFAEIECSYDETKWNRIRIDDDFKGTIKYYVNDELMAIVEYSELGEYDTFEGEKFYKKVTIKDAEGNQLATTDSAYVYESSEIAYGMRTASLNVDNIIIKTLEVEEE